MNTPQGSAFTFQGTLVNQDAKAGSLVSEIIWACHHPITNPLAEPLYL
jgi:hypothetical protein